MKNNAWVVVANIYTILLVLLGADMLRHVYFKIININTISNYYAELTNVLKIYWFDIIMGLSISIGAVLFFLTRKAGWFCLIIWLLIFLITVTKNFIFYSFPLDFLLSFSACLLGNISFFTNSVRNKYGIGIIEIISAFVIATILFLLSK
jgi:hypothetical protein